jgi:hypothetical protein
MLKWRKVILMKLPAQFTRYGRDGIIRSLPKGESSTNVNIIFRTAVKYKSYFTQEYSLRGRISEFRMFSELFEEIEDEFGEKYHGLHLMLLEYLHIVRRDGLGIWLGWVK